MADLRFPIGKYSPPETITEEHVAGWIEDIRQFPQTIRSLVEGMTEEQLNTPYRPGAGPSGRCASVGFGECRGGICRAPACDRPDPEPVRPAARAHARHRADALGRPADRRRALRVRPLPRGVAPRGVRDGQDRDRSEVRAIFREPLSHDP